MRFAFSCCSLRAFCLACLFFLWMAGCTTADTTDTEKGNHDQPFGPESVIMQSDTGENIAAINAREESLAGKLEGLIQWMNLSGARITTLEGQMAALASWMACAGRATQRDDFADNIKSIEESFREQLVAAEQSLKNDYETAYNRLRDYQKKGDEHLDRWLVFLAILVGALPIGIALIQWLAGRCRFRLAKRDILQAKKGIRKANIDIQKAKSDLQRAKCEFQNAIQQAQNDIQTAIIQLQEEKNREIAQLTREGVEAMFVPFATLILMTDILGVRAAGGSSENFMLVLAPTITCFHRLLSQCLKIKDSALIRRGIGVFKVFAQHWGNTGNPKSLLAWRGALSAVKRSLDKEGIQWDKKAFAEILGAETDEFRWLEEFYNEMDEAVRIMGNLPLGNWTPTDANVGEGVSGGA